MIRPAWSGTRVAFAAAWRTRMFRVTLGLVALALLVRGARPVLLLPGVYYGVRFVRLATRRILYSVRARLVAFYLYSALLPILMVATILLFLGYLVLGQVSARVVEERLGHLASWVEEHAHRAETGYWRARAAGLPPVEAAAQALEAAYGGAREPGLACWVADGRGQVLEARGPLTPDDLRVPAWLGEHGFAGLVAVDSVRLELRTRLRFVEPSGAVELGCVVPVDTRILNAGLGDSSRTAWEAGAARAADSTIAGTGILACIAPGRKVVVGSSTITVTSAPTAGIATGAGGDSVLRGGSRPGGGGGPDRSVSGAPISEEFALRARLRSRYQVLGWPYIGYPLAWSTGKRDEPGPLLRIVFTVEGAGHALLHTGFGVIAQLWWIVVAVVGILMLLLVIGTLRGLLYARTISNSVAKLDHGVRAIRGGDFGFRVQPRERDQLGTLALAFNDMSQRLQDLLEERIAHRAVERELALARDVQSRLFPERMPDTPFLQATGLCLPARTVSGDYYDFIDLGCGWDAVVADVSGKGISAALLMASLQAALRGQYPPDGRGAAPDPAEVLTRLNSHLHAHVEPNRFVTLFLVRYGGGGRLLYGNAGHNPAALVRGAEVQWLSAGGPMLGPFAGQRFATASVDVQPGDLVCLYSDGVTEAESPAGDFFGEERLAAVLCAHAGEHPREVEAGVLRRLQEWRSGKEAGDDVTVVVLRITG